MSNHPSLRQRRQHLPTPGPIPQTISPDEEQPAAARIRDERIKNLLYRGNWNDNRDGLAPQLTRRHIQMVSIGLSIGTGIFLGTGEAIKDGGTAGILLGYLVIAAVVYCFTMSISEMISFLPNIHGPVGLANKFVDPALGFAMGWNSWYSWTIVLPAEISAASALVNFWNPPPAVAAVWPAFFLMVAIGINCVGVGRYGEIEFWFSFIKVFTIIMLLIIGVVLDAGGGDQGPIGFKNWKDPFASYLEIPGDLGHFLGFYAVMIQATFSFFGSELPGVVAGEVINARQSVPIALKRTWFKIFVLYMGGVFMAGLLVPADHPALVGSGTKYWLSSPFIIALEEAGPKWTRLSHLFIVLFISSAWSAATADVYISSRYLYFLAKTGLAPAFLGYVYTNAPKRQLAQGFPTGERALPVALTAPRPVLRRDATWVSGVSAETAIESGHDGHRKEKSEGYEQDVISPTTCHLRSQSAPGEVVRPTIDGMRGSWFKKSTSEKEMTIVAIPWVGIVVAALFSMMSFMKIRGSSQDPRSAEKAFIWLASMTTAASLQSWMAMLFTYIRWYQGTRYREKQNEKYPNNPRYSKEIEELKKNRHWGQPWLAVFAMTMCFLVSFFHGWAILKTGQWKVYRKRDETPKERDEHSERVTTFITCYLPIPVFLLLTFGFKLINQTKMVLVEDMKFDRDARAALLENPKEDQPPAEWYNKIVWFLFS